ncbi:unnamed protein product [Acanthoscelides obtectus]|nr:unnamed protein product [Acanthoscelides obtectus]
MNNGANWTLERDQDRAGPYIFSKNNWIAFDDASSLDIKSKYARVRGLAGIALKDVSQDASEDGCESAVDTVHAALSTKGRAPRAALLHDLERELEGESTEVHAGVRLSPYRITRVVDIEGKHHVIRQDTRTEFSCTRQGYFVHPRSCNRFYRCVKFDQTSDDYSVFEFECPAGLAFDERVEVCVWPGSLPEGQPCQGSAEIAPVPRQRFVCPHEQGYYADPENCRWFFACMDHGTSELTPYEFRCPYGLYFDSDRLICEWPWLVPKCGQGRAGYSEFTYGGPSLNHYDGLGTLGLVKLGGLSGHVEQPIVYSNVGAGQNVYNSGFGSLGYGAAYALKNAGLIKEDQLNSGRNDFAYQYNAGAGAQYSAGFAGTHPSENQDFANSANVQNNQGAYESNFDADGNYGQKIGAFGYNSGSAGGSQFASNLANNINTLHAYQGQTSGALYQANSAVNNGGSNAYGSGAQFEANLVNNVESLNQYQGTAYKQQTDSGESDFSSYQYSGQDQGAQYKSNQASRVDINGQYQGKGEVQGLGAYSTNQYYGHDSKVQYEANLANNIDTLSKYQSNNGQQSLGAATADGGNAAFGNVQSTTYAANTAGVGNKVYQVGVGNTGVGATSTQTFNRYDSRSKNMQQHGLLGLGSTLQKDTSFNNAANLIVSTQQQNTGATSQYFGNYQNENILINNLDDIDHNANLDYDLRQAYQHGINGNINIVGGGYSAVGDTGSGIQVNGETYVRVAQSTPASVPVTTVTSVPLPSIKTDSGFEGYNGGVIANIPELQHKVQGETGLTNVSYEFGSSTPSSILTSTDLHVNTANVLSSVPAVSFPSTTARPFSVHTTSGDASSYRFQSTGTTYSTPSPAVTYISTTPTASVTSSVSSHGATGSIYNYGTYSTSSPGVTFVSTTPRPAVTIPFSSHVTNGNTYSTVQTYETPVVSYVSSTAKPASIISHSYTPTVAYSGAGVSSYNRVNPPTTPGTVFMANQVSHISQAGDASFSGYNYDKPSITFEESQKPVTFSTPMPIISSKVQPTYISQNVDTSFGGYSYEQPTIKFDESPKYSPASTPKSVFLSTTERPALSYVSKSVDGSFTGNDYANPTVKFEPLRQTVIVSTPRPFTSTIVAPVVKTGGYAYNKPAIAFEEQPISSVREESGYVYDKPSIEFDGRPLVHSNVISKFSIRKPAIQYSGVSYNQEAVQVNYKNVVNADSFQQGLVSSYYDQQPVSRYTYKDVVQQAVARVQPIDYFVQTTPRPAVASSYSYQQPILKYGYQDVKQQAVVQPVYSTTVQPVEYSVQTTPKPADVYSYFYQKPITKYSYQDIVQQAVVKQPVNYTPAQTYVPTTAESPTYYYREPTVTEYNYPSTTYNYVAPSSSKPAVVSSYSYTAPTTEKPTVYVQQGYDYPKPSVNFVEEPKPSVTYVPSTTPATTREQTHFRGYNYQRPTIAFEETTTPRPYVTYEDREKVIEEEFVKKTAYVTGEEVDNGVSPVVATGDTPVVVEDYRAFNYNKIKANSIIYQQTTSKPTLISTIRSIASSRTPVTEYPNYYYFDSRLSSPTATSTYLPPTKEYLPATTYTTPAYQPTRIRVSTPAPTTFRPRPKATSTYLPPTREYLPATTSEYEPVRTAAPVTTTYLPPTTYRARVKVATPEPSTPYLPARVSTTTYLPPPTRSRVRVTTHAPSSTYLPVEVTTLSRNYLPARTVIKQNDVHPLLSAKLGAQCTCVTNALKSGRRQKIIVVDDDDDDDGYVVDNGRAIENYEYDSRKIVDITPTPEVYVKNTRQLSSRVTDGEILNAVKTGLKLVKEAAREGAEEGVEKVLSRSRDSIECNRAGLFRHPNQCNKFYSCRWDCTKNKYTVHTFNCPIHLTFDSSLGACNWPSQGPACMENTLLPSE